jgi:hypothetical protein
MNNSRVMESKMNASFEKKIMNNASAYKFTKD